ncbi:MAG: bifunctional diguanylate cyclase/phosphodiesterase [Telluria sp.]
MTALLISVLAVGTSAMLYVSYEDAVREQKISLRNLSVAFAAQTLSVAQGVYQVMDQVSRTYRNSDARELALPTYFEDDGPAREYLLGIHVFDQGGNLVASGSPAAASAHPGNGLAALTAPQLAEASGPRITISNIDPKTGRGVMNFAQAIIGSEGNPIGSVLAQVDSERFERIYTLVELGEGGSVTLFHRDGTMLVRGPNLPSGIGSSFFHTPLFQAYLPVAGHGGFESISPIDGVLRLYGYDSVPGFPLAIIVGMNKSDALATWYGRLWTAIIFLAMIAATMIYVAFRVARDAGRQFKLIEQLAASESRADASATYLATILNAVGTPIWVIDSTRRFVMMNEAFSRFIGKPAENLVGRPEHEVLDPQNVNERERRYLQVLANAADTSEAVTEIQDGSGEPRTVIQLTSKLLDVTGQAQLVSVLTDITERQRAEARLAYLANFDSLTGLPNQSQFRRILEAELCEANGRGDCLGTIMVSLKRLHEISDLLGQEAGDRALKQVGDIFRALLPRAVEVARIKSAEFAVVVQAEGGRDAIEEFALELQQRLSGPMTVSGRDFYLGPVMGVAVFPNDGSTADELYRRAESARNRDSANEDEGIHFFSPSTHTDLDERLAIEAQLRRALDRQEFRLEYQPKVNIADGHIVGFEALLRWTNPVLGAVSPVQFIPIAERTGLIIQIGAWVLEQTCQQVRKWTAETGSPVKVAVNLSPRQFHQKDLLPTIRECVERWGIPPGTLELEITETALVSREQEVDVLMRGIRALGVELSIDDFGTGYSSLAYLKRFPVQRLKVDRAFIRDLGRDEDSAAIILSVINLARGLKLKVVAEGVETQEQLAMLREMSCDEYQGFLFSRPVGAADVIGLIEQNRAMAS